MLLTLFGDYEAGAEEDKEPTWQEFEEQIRDVLECAGFSTDFRKVFVAAGRRHEIDVVAHRFDTTILIDAKRYGKARLRSSSIRAQARKHLARCGEFERAFSVSSVPVIVSWIDDALLSEGGCFIVPFDKLEDFVVHLERYVDSIGELDAGNSIIDNINENGIF
ncbi:MAG: restriction endonuclease [Halobacteriota archaeon]|jgi:Holliday junction resolvase-like predicted endonuclease